MPDHYLQLLTGHVHWLPPYGPTDRPALGVVQGTRETLLIDTGNSPAHARLLHDGVAATRGARAQRGDADALALGPLLRQRGLRRAVVRSYRDAAYGHGAGRAALGRCGT